MLLILRSKFVSGRNMQVNNFGREVRMQPLILCFSYCIIGKFIKVYKNGLLNNEQYPESVLGSCGPNLSESFLS